MGRLRWADKPRILELGEAVEEVGQILSTGSSQLLQQEGTLLYFVAENQRLEIWGIANPSEPKLLSHYSTESTILKIAVLDNYLYLATFLFEVEIVDISDVVTPKLVERQSFTPRSGYDASLTAITVHQDHLFLGFSTCTYLCQGELKIMELSSGISPKEVDSMTFDQGITAIDGQGDWLAFTSQSCGSGSCSGMVNLLALPPLVQKPTSISRIELPGRLTDISLLENGLFVAGTEAGLYWLDW